MALLTEKNYRSWFAGFSFCRRSYIARATLARVFSDEDPVFAPFLSAVLTVNHPWPLASLAWFAFSIHFSPRLVRRRWS